MRQDEIKLEIEYPKEVQISLDGNELIIKGPKGEIKRKFDTKKVIINLENGKVILLTKRPTKKEKALINTYRAHITNMIKGVTELFKYQLKICSTHFPMNVSFSKEEIVIKNFYGEKFPRKLSISSGVKCKINDKIIELEGVDKEKVGHTASNIEQLTRIPNKDPRVFQDGIYIINKAGKELK